jgi:hypothetical protein
MRVLDNEQRRILIDIGQLYENELEIRRRIRDYRGGMTWKKAKDREYLFRLSGRTGHGKSLGARSAGTEKLYKQFHQGKAAVQERLVKAKERGAHYARLARAFQLERVPTVVAKVLRELAVRRLLGREFIVLGTSALYAYEARAGVRIDPALTASGDVDLFYDARRRLALAAAKFDEGGLLGLLRQVDRSFEPIRAHGFRAVNSDEFMVDLIVAPRDMRDASTVRFGESDLVASEVPSLEWLASAPKFDAVSVALDGRAVPLTAPDPRAFSVHKAWLSTCLDRDPLKRPRDRGQAEIVARIVQEYFPHLPFTEEYLRFFPKKLLRANLGRLVKAEVSARGE